MLKKISTIILVIFFLIFVLFFTASGCATDFKVLGPSFSMRTGAGDGPSRAIARQSLGSTTRMGSSAAGRSPTSD